MNIEIIGDGAWGSALYELVTRSGHTVGQDGDLVLIAVPAEYFRVAANKIMNKSRPVIICTKGMEPGTHLFMSEILTELGFTHFGVLSGPQFAAEVAAGLPTGSTLAGDDDLLAMGRMALGELYLETTNDIVGTELCGCGKNAVSITAGFYSVRAAGENERAMMISRAWREVADFGKIIGAQTETFLTLAGTGDLFLSATSVTSRNFSAGIALANGHPISGTVEGIHALRGIVHRGKSVNSTMPVLISIDNLLPA